MSFGDNDKPSQPVAPAPSLPPLLFGLQQAPGTKKPKPKGYNPTFLGTEAAPSPGGTGAKTLLGE